MPIRLHRHPKMESTDACLSPRSMAEVELPADAQYSYKVSHSNST
jgi:hypothetical protein